MCPFRLGKNANSKEDLLKSFLILNALQANGDHVESFTSKHLHSEDGQPIDEETEQNIKWCSASLFIGGGETVWFFLFHSMISTHSFRKDGISVEKLFLPDDYESVCPGEGTS
jgi:hypothetical protein